MKTEGETGANTRPESAKTSCESKNVGNITPDTRNDGNRKPELRKERNRLFFGFVKKHMQLHRLQQKSGAVSAKSHSSCHVKYRHLHFSPHCLHHHHHHHHEPKDSRRLDQTPSNQFPRNLDHTQSAFIEQNRQPSSGAVIQNSSIWSCRLVSRSPDPHEKRCATREASWQDGKLYVNEVYTRYDWLIREGIFFLKTRGWFWICFVMRGPWYSHWSHWDWNADSVFPAEEWRVWIWGKSYNCFFLFQLKWFWAGQNKDMGSV